MEKIIDIIGFDPFNLPDNKCNKKHAFFFKVRALFKTMLYVHSQLNFERMFDPDLNHYIKKYSSHTKQVEDYFPIDYDPKKYRKTRIGNCGIYSDYFEQLAREMGFEVRHIGLKDPNTRSGHWCSEVKVGQNWLFVDSMFLVFPALRYDKTGQMFSAYHIMSDPIGLYYNEIPTILRGMTKTTIKQLWKGLEINGETSYQLGLKNFVRKYYGQV